MAAVQMTGQLHAGPGCRVSAWVPLTSWGPKTSTLVPDTRAWSCLPVGTIAGMTEGSPKGFVSAPASEDPRGM